MGNQIETQIMAGIWRCGKQVFKIVRLVLIPTGFMVLYVVAFFELGGLDDNKNYECIVEGNSTKPLFYTGTAEKALEDLTANRTPFTNYSSILKYYLVWGFA